MKYSVILDLSFATIAIASPFVKLHERREHNPQAWRKYDRLDAAAILPMRIALKQSNLDLVYDHLMEISHPESARFGQHWSVKEVAEEFMPSKESVEIVTTWLVASGVPGETISRSRSQGWLQFHATAAQAERLLDTEYHIYKHQLSGQAHIACSAYSIPEHVQNHVDFITPTVHFDARIGASEADILAKGERQISSQNAESSWKRDIVGGIGSASNGWRPKKGKIIGVLKYILGLINNALVETLFPCSSYIRPSCLRQLYGIPANPPTNSTNSIGIVEYTPQCYYETDLMEFFTVFSPNQQQESPILNSIDGGPLCNAPTSFGNQGEAGLDLEYSMSIVNPGLVTLYQVGDTVESASFDNFLDAIDADYCSFEGGDNPAYDPEYPDSASGGYDGPENCGGFAATNVISTSYGYNEGDLTPAYEQRQCAEYAKLGLQGVSVFYSSGDSGVGGNGGECIDSFNDDGTANYNSGSNGTFNPSFPGTCPYVTSVGATQIPAGGSTTQPEVACQSVIASGGGFSNNFALPAFQMDAVQNWFQQYSPGYPEGTYNDSQQSRGYPDVSANGANYVVAIDGTFMTVFGTSAAAPVFASVVSIINAARLNLNKSSLGFLNPTLYANPQVLNDITSGNNPGCGTDGFQASPGWDPVTGLGTPNYQKMLDLFTSLP